MIFKKTIQKVGIEGTYQNIMKVIYDKPTVKIIFSYATLSEKYRQNTSKKPACYSLLNSKKHFFFTEEQAPLLVLSLCLRLVTL